MNFLRLLSTTELFKYQVRDQLGEQYGHIKELFIHPESRQILFAVVAKGGVFGLGSDYIALPWVALQALPSGDSFVVAMDHAKINEAPKFSLEELGNTDMKAVGELYHYYGSPKFWEENTMNSQDSVFKDAQQTGAVHEAHEGAHQITNYHPQDSKLSDNMSKDKIDKGE